MGIGNRKQAEQSFALRNGEKRVIAKLWWIVHKDLLTESRSRQVWPPMLLFGTIVAFLFSIQMDLTFQERKRIVGVLLWIATYFAGTLALGRSFMLEREEGCWHGLLLYPVAPSTIYLAKLAANTTALAILQCALIPLFVVFVGVPLLDRPWEMLLVALLGNLGITSVGTLLSALASGFRNNNSLLAMLVLPLVFPVLLAASEATRLIAMGDIDSQWWRWVQLLAACTIVFITVGTVLFEFVLED